MKKLILFVSIVLLFALVKGFWSADMCGEDMIKLQVENFYKDLGNNEVGGWLQEDMNKKVQAGTISSEDVEGLIKANLEVGYRNKHECQIPEDLTNKLTSPYLKSDSAVLECPNGMFKEDAAKKLQAAYLELGQEKLQSLIYDKIISQISRAKEDRDKFTTFWEEDVNFRNEIMLAVYQIVERENYGCSNQMLPISNILLTLMRK